ncbi:MAG: hypothetical protein JW797_14425 [Bradymonadales bacterium]|nr:hypothetical protein [Bradymonadales bacterium]
MSRLSSTGRLLGGALLVALMATSSPFSDAVPLPALDPGRTQPLDLRYQYAANSADQYQVRFSLRATRSTFVLPIDDQVDVSGSMDFRQGFQGLDEARNAVVFHEVGGLSLSYTSNGEAIATDQIQGRLAGVTRRLKLGGQGQVLDEEILVAEDLPRSLPHLPRMADVWEWMRLELPVGSVSLGDNWVQQYRYAMDSSEELPLEFTLTATHTYLGQAQVSGVWCAVIQTTLEMPIEIDPPRAFQTDQPILGRGTGRAVYYFDADAGRLVGGQVEFGLVMQTHVPDNPIDFTATVSLQFERTS